MAKSKKYKRIVEKSIKASLVALEIYNKPNFEYKEEVFAIMMASAWELLLKAKIIKTKGTFQSVYAPAKLKTKKGKNLKRFYPKTNRSGNPLTIDIFKAAEVAGLDTEIKSNIEVLVEVRDNSIHFINEHPDFKRKMLEVATASITNYAQYLRENFKENVDGYAFSFTPISFSNPSRMPILTISAPHNNWLKYIDKQEKKLNKRKSKYNLTLSIETKFKKSDSGETVTAKWGKDGIIMKVEEENVFISKYNIDYETLIKTCKERYSNFVLNNTFYSIKKTLEDDSYSERYAKIRYLRPDKTGTTKKVCYCSEIYNELDKRYSRK